MGKTAKYAKYGRPCQICIFGRAKYGQEGCPWKDLAKYRSDALVLGEYDPPVKKYDKIKFLADITIVITM